MQIIDLQASIKKKSKAIELLRVIIRAIRKFQEKKQREYEELRLKSLEKEIN